MCAQNVYSGFQARVGVCNAQMCRVLHTSPLALKLLPALGFGLHGCLTLTLTWTWSSPQQRAHERESERARDSRAQRWHWIKILLWRLDLFKLRVVCVAFIKVDGALIFLLAGLCVCVRVFTTYCLVQCRSDGQPAEEVNSFLLNFCSFVVGGTIALHWVALSLWEEPAAIFLHYKSNIGLQKGHGCFSTKHVHGLRFLNNRHCGAKWHFWNTCQLQVNRENTVLKFRVTEMFLV